MLKPESGIKWMALGENGINHSGAFLETAMVARLKGPVEGPALEVEWLTLVLFLIKMSKLEEPH